MLTKLKWIFGLLLFVTVFVVLHYNLPQRDIVRITGTEVLRKDFSGWTRMFYAKPDTGDVLSFNRDLRLINSVKRGRLSIGKAVPLLPQIIAYPVIYKGGESCQGQL